MTYKAKRRSVQSGEVYGRLTIIEFSHYDKHHRKHFSVMCQCGATKTVQGSLMTSGNTRSCGCLARETAAATRIANNHGEVTAIILGYKRHAKARGYEWRLSRSDVETMIHMNCKYCGMPPSNIKITKNTINPLLYSGIDRVDNNLDYIAENTVPCCSQCNSAKRDMSAAEFIKWARRVAEHATP